MQAYSSEQEQIDAIKKWMRENGLAVFVGVAVGFGGLWGWQAWQDFIDRRAEQASTLYNQILINMDNAQTANVDQFADELVEKYAMTSYASLAALAAAKVAAVDSRYDASKERLQWVIDNSQQAELLPLAKLRLARLMLMEENVEEAAALIEATEFPASYTARVAELQGDLHVLKGETEQASVAYQTAISAQIPAQNREMIQIKLDALSPVAETDETADSGETVSAAE